MSYNEEQMREIFFQEMSEVFEHIDSCILVLERTPNDIEIIKNLFREVHTLKGSSGVFGLREIADLTHHAEDILDRMREGKLSPTEEVFSALLKCFDRLKDMMNAAKQRRDLASFDNSDMVTNLLSFKGMVASKKHTTRTDFASEPLGPGESPFEVSITGGDQFFIMGIDPVTILMNCRDTSTGLFSVYTNIDRIPSLEEIEPERCYLEFNLQFISRAELKEVQDIFEFAMATSSVKIDMGASGGQSAPTAVAPLAQTPAASTAPQASTTPTAPQALTTPSPSTPPAVAPKGDATTTAPATTTAAAAASPASDSNDFVRLKKEKLDQLMNLVGELITVKNLFVHLSNRLEETMPDSEVTKGFKEGTGHVTRLSARLQESVMNARMVPVGSVFTRYTRLIRDIAKKLNKKVNLVIEGEETELDKTVSEAISDPVMHLIRNSIDHGIEAPELRRGRGKPEAGTLLLKASYEGNNVKLIVKDDGNGIDLERVKTKAINLGLVTAEQANLLSKKEIVEYIFHSGFSTAAEITDISGRGVGMDVVRNNIRKSSGSIFVDTEAGQGTEFRIILPLSLAVIEALLVGVGGETYALPQEVITETVRADKKDIVALNNQPSINLRGEVIPLLRLNEVINLRPSVLDSFIKQEKSKLEKNDSEYFSGKKDNDEDRHEQLTNPIVIVQIDGLKVGILVDALYWQEQIMIKPLGGFLTNIPVFTGACIMGDGSVVLVLEPKELYNCARSMGEMAEQNKAA